MGVTQERWIVRKNTQALVYLRDIGSFFIIIKMMFYEGNTEALVC